MDNPADTPRDHGGNLADAMARYGGATEDWLDLSTGINPMAWPVGPISNAAWTRLPDKSASDALLAAARRTYDIAPEAEVIAAPGASALIRLMPRLAHPTTVAIPGPTYNEHAAAFVAEGWQVTEHPGPGVTAAVIVNPNNPDGRLWALEELQVMAEAMDLLVVDESFMDPTPEGSMAAIAGREGLVILRSFGKFYGLAGLRLGFAITGPETARRLAELLGPWAVSGPALEIGAAALRDDDWAEAERTRLDRAVARLVKLAEQAGWRHVGGTTLFRTFDTPGAVAAQHRLAEHRIWSRVFPYSGTWLRLGLPGTADEWERLERALA